jgi:spore maturation protein CgeB
MYEIDPDLSEIPTISKLPESTRIFTFRTSRAVEYVKKGWNATYLPLAAAPRMFPQPERRFQCDLSFVGTSIIGNAILLLDVLKRSKLPEPAEKMLDHFIERQKSEPERFLADETFAALISEGVPAQLRTERGFLSVRKILHEWSGAIHRIHLVTALAPFGIQVWGDEGWNEIAKTHPGLTYRGPAGNRIEVPKIYSSSRINVDVTRSYQPDVATIRLFDVFACGSLCVTNVTGEALSLYKNPQLLTFNSAKELQERVSHVLSWTADEYNDYCKAMQQQTLNHHMLGNRLQTMLSEIHSL